MKLKQTFDLNRLRCEIGMKQALKHWQLPHPIPEPECPKCQSKFITTYGWIKGAQKPRRQYQCKDCQRIFRERLRWECCCSIPGQKARCQNCPYFEHFLDSVKQKTEELKNFNQTQLKDLL